MGMGGGGGRGAGRHRNSAQRQAELKRLASEIKLHDTAYYLADAPKIADAAYDALRARNTIRSLSRFSTAPPTTIIGAVKPPVVSRR